MPKDETNPLAAFDPIPVEDFDTEMEKAKIPPLTPATYKWEVIEVEVGPARTSGAMRASFKAQVVEDEDETCNGRKANFGLMLEGGGFPFFLRFAEAVEHKWGKAGIDKKYIDGFVGKKFKAYAESVYETEADNKTFKFDEEGSRILTSFSELIDIEGVMG